MYHAERRCGPFSLTTLVRCAEGPRPPGGISIRSCRPPDHTQRLQPLLPVRHSAIRLPRQLAPAPVFSHKNALRPHSCSCSRSIESDTRRWVSVGYHVSQRFPGRFPMAVYSRFFSTARVALVLSVLPLASDLCAQRSIDAAFSDLKPGQTVRLRTQGGDRSQSRVDSVQTESLALWLEGASTPYDGATLDSLWVRGRASTTGAIVGGLVLGSATFAAGALLCSGLDEGNSCTEWGTVTAFSLAGAAGGALLGAAIGSAIPKWRLRYTRGLPVRGALRTLPQGRFGLGIAYAVGW